MSPTSRLLISQAALAGRLDLMAETAFRLISAISDFQSAWHDGARENAVQELDRAQRDALMNVIYRVAQDVRATQ